MSYGKTKIILSLSIVLFVSLFSLFIFSYLKLNNNFTYVENLQQSIITEKQSLDSFNALVKNASNIKADSEKVNGYFVKRDEVVNFLDVVESLAFTTNTKITIQSVGDTKNQANNYILSISLNAKGSYSNIYHLLSMLEELPYISEIQNVRLANSFSKNDKGQDVNYWSADINILSVMY